jgi:hypothetical protein
VKEFERSDSHHIQEIIIDYVDEGEYGPVYISAGRHRGRIGYYDDDELKSGFVYFGDYFTASESALIQRRYFKYPTVRDLLGRREAIRSKLFGKINGIKRDSHIKIDTMYSFSAELNYIDGILSERMFNGRFMKIEVRKRIYLAHSSLDKPLVRQVHDDLKRLGHNPWLDENEIEIGDSIPVSLQVALDHSDYIIVFLSPNSIMSKWVEIEWVSKFWQEIDHKKKFILPAMIEDCQIPPFLVSRKYADFRTDYNSALADVLKAIK